MGQAACVPQGCEARGDASDAKVAEGVKQVFADEEAFFLKAIAAPKVQEEPARCAGTAPQVSKPKEDEALAEPEPETVEKCEDEAKPLIEETPKEKKASQKSSSGGKNKGSKEDKNKDSIVKPEKSKEAQLAEFLAHKKKVEEINMRISKVMEDAANSPNAGGIFSLMKDQMKNQVISDNEALRGRPEKMQVSKNHYILHSLMEGPWAESAKTIVLATGCYWGSEKGFWRLPGVICTAVGFAAGFTPNPTYNEVCGSRTGATEAVRVVFDPEKISVVDILRWFWESHDPTQGMAQGNDRGTMYRSGAYYFEEEHKLLIEASRVAYGKALRKAGRGSGPITTEIKSADDFSTRPGSVFYLAEDYHQQYLAKPGSTRYCSAQPQKVSLPPFDTWAPPGMKHHEPKLNERFWAKHGPKPGCCLKAPDQPIVWVSNRMEPP